MSVALDYIAAVKPDVLIHGGDFWDWPQFTRHTKYEVNHTSFFEAIDMGNNLVDMMVQAAGPKSRIVILEGNHDSHPKRHAINNDPELAQLVPDMDDMLCLRERKIEFMPIQCDENHPVPDQRDFMIGSVHVYHGYQGGQNAAALAMRNNPGRDQMFFHIHKETVANSGGLGSNRFYAVTVPCLCRLYPEWKRGRPNDWEHGIGEIFWDDKTGWCEMRVHKIKHGKMTVMGEQYG